MGTAHLKPGASCPAEHLQTEASSGIKPTSLPGQAGISSQLVDLGRGVFVGILRVNRLAAGQVDLDIEVGNGNPLGTIADEIHFYAPLFLMVNGAVAKSPQIEA